jgi:hypothetical protein
LFEIVFATPQLPIHNTANVTAQIKNSFFIFFLFWCVSGSKTRLNFYMIDTIR